jgi:hypothetical protein
MLVARPVLFVGFQILFALGFGLGGANDAWGSAAAWWPVIVTLANLATVLILVRLYRDEGRRFWDVFHVEPRRMPVDLLLVLASFIIGGPVAFLPNVWLSTWLFGDPQAVLELFVRPLPLWAAWTAVIAFPITQGLAELANYMAYALPRIESQGLRAWQAVLIAGLFLGIQHAAAPLLFHGPFFIWRLLMYIPFACWAALLMRWRPRLLPYMAAIHALMNMSFATMFLPLAY